MCSPDFLQNIAVPDRFAESGASSAIADADAMKTASARTIFILPFAENDRRTHFS
jgi:hypothetical protein